MQINRYTMLDSIHSLKNKILRMYLFLLLGLTLNRELDQTTFRILSQKLIWISWIKETLYLTLISKVVIYFMFIKIMRKRIRYKPMIWFCRMIPTAKVIINGLISKSPTLRKIWELNLTLLIWLKSNPILVMVSNL